VGGPWIAPSARKHGVSDSTILDAFHTRFEDLDDDMLMIIGPDSAGNLYEFGVLVSTDGPIVVHAMAARPKYLR
jgi:hypothetical protein